MPPIGPRRSLVGLAHRTDRSDLVGRVRLEDRRQAGDAALDDLLVDHVGLVDAELRLPPTGVFSTFTVDARTRRRRPVGSTRAR